MRTAPNLPFPDLPAGDRTAEQLVRDLRACIDEGHLQAGQRLPSTRLWAARLGVARSTLVAVYEQLCGEGYLISGQGQGTRVHPDLSIAASAETASRSACRHRNWTNISQPTPNEIDLTIDSSTSASLNSPRWRSAWRDAAGAKSTPQTPAGLRELRERVSEHLEHFRQVRRDPDEIVITSGTREGLALLCRALWHHGARIGVERPGYPTMRAALRALGCSLVSVPVDASGVVPPLVRGDRLDALLVTPSHQYPFGGELQRERRSALLDWAESTHSLLLEDDYDAELRESGGPVPALCALDNPVLGRVVTFGTFSKLLAADIGVGYMIVPRQLLPSVLRVREALGTPVPRIAQVALADYLRSGELQRHLARMRRQSRRRRELVATVFEGLPGVRVLPMDGGLHSVIEIPGSERRVLAECTARHVRVTGLSTYWGGSRTTPVAGVVVGYAHPNLTQFQTGLERVRDSIVAVA